MYSFMHFCEFFICAVAFLRGVAAKLASDIQHCIGIILIVSTG